jgi:hypothetical protein
LEKQISLIILKEHNHIVKWFIENNIKNISAVCFDFHCDLRNAQYDSKKKYIQLPDTHKIDSGNFYNFLIKKKIISDLTWYYPSQSVILQDWKTINFIENYEYKENYSVMNFEFQHSLHNKNIDINGKWLDIDWDYFNSLSFDSEQTKILMDFFSLTYTVNQSEYLLVIRLNMCITMNNYSMNSLKK